MPLDGQVSDAGRLVRRCKAGDVRAWDALVERYSSLVYSVARRAGLNADDASDCAQSVFIKLYQALDRIDNPDALSGWLSVTTAREAYRMKRLSNRYVNLDADNRTLDELIAAEEASADELAEQSDSVFKITAAIDQLKDKCRELLTALYLVDSPSYQEISARLKIPVGSIGPTRARCIEALRGLLSKTGFFAVSDPGQARSRQVKR